MQRDDNDTLLQIANAAQRIARFIHGLDAAAFNTNEEKQSAVQHQLLIIGEAVTRLSQTFRAQHPAIPWTRIAGMRNRLTHGYDVVNMDIVWQVATQDAPALLQYITPLLPAEENSESP